MVVGVADHAARRAPPPGPGPDRRRRVGARPHGGVRLDAGDVSKTELRERRTQPGVGAVAGVHQDHAGRGAGLERSPDLVESISGFVLNVTSSGTPAFFRRAGSAAQSFGRYSLYAIGKLAPAFASDSAGLRAGACAPMCGLTLAQTASSRAAGSTLPCT